MTRLMSVWQQATVAAKNAVDAPMKVTNASAYGAYSISGDIRAIRNTPAVTMVAAWMRAETGVGPSIASGSQTCRPNCADLPMAPMNSSTPMTSSIGRSRPNSRYVSAVCLATLGKMTENSIEPKARKINAMPTANGRSAMRLTMNALIAAAYAAGRSYQ